jgi:hypothetical protein
MSRADELNAQINNIDTDLYELRKESAFIDEQRAANQRSIDALMEQRRVLVNRLIKLTNSDVKSGALRLYVDGRSVR